MVGARRRCSFWCLQYSHGGDHGTQLVVWGSTSQRVGCLEICFKLHTKEMRERCTYTWREDWDFLSSLLRLDAELEVSSFLKNGWGRTDVDIILSIIMLHSAPSWLPGRSASSQLTKLIVCWACRQRIWLRSKVMWQFSRRRASWTKSEPFNS